jgi:hypothetical protein
VSPLQTIGGSTSSGYFRCSSAKSVLASSPGWFAGNPADRYKYLAVAEHRLAGCLTFIPDSRFKDRTERLAYSRRSSRGGRQTERLRKSYPPAPEVSGVTDWRWIETDQMSDAEILDPTFPGGRSTPSGKHPNLGQYWTGVSVEEGRSRLAGSFVCDDFLFPRELWRDGARPLESRQALRNIAAFAGKAYME